MQANKKLPGSNLEEKIMELLIRDKVPTTVFLVNGVKLQGNVTAHDHDTVLLRREAHSQLIYKHAISTVMPNEAIEIPER